MKHNAAGLSWKEGVNQFSAMTSDEKKAYMGYHKGVARAQRLKTVQPSDLPMRPVSELPPSVDWRSKSVVSPVKDQGGCGSCWAFAATAVIESHVALNSGLLFDLSPQQITSCAPNPDQCGGTGGCTGATCELAFDYVAGTTTGILQEFQYSYSSYYGNTGACQVIELGGCEQIIVCRSHIVIIFRYRVWAWLLSVGTLNCPRTTIRLS